MAERSKEYASKESDVTVKYANLFPDSYFADRNFTDERRRVAIENECSWLKACKVDFGGTICDVGCSTGEFLTVSNWTGKKYGLEVNRYAQKLAEENGIDFSLNILNSENYFDVIVMRGVIQHLDQPYYYIERSFEALRPGGFFAVLQTPNIGSIYYRLFKQLPALEVDNTFCLPDFGQLKRITERNGFEIVASDSPYWKSPYCRPSVDFIKFFARFLTQSPKFSSAFPGNMMNILFRKPLKA